MNKDFHKAILKNQSSFDLQLTEEQIVKLSDYYKLINRNNKLLHLVGPCSTEEFVIRHILESLYALHFMPENAKFADIGSGAGLPGIPCLIVRESLFGVLIESKTKKSAFLKEAIAECGLEKRAEIFDRQFEEIRKPDVSFVTCRALDKFTKKLPKILKWSKKATLLLFSGNAMREELKKQNVKFKEKLLPMSEQRFLFRTGNNL